jgi:hypothetical protein
MKHGATSVSGRLILGIDVKTDEVIELKAPFLPQIRMRKSRHECPFAHSHVSQISRPELSSRSEDHGADRRHGGHN